MKYHDSLHFLFYIIRIIYVFNLDTCIFIIYNSSKELPTGTANNFPDLDGCYTCGDNLEDGMNMAQDALSLMLTHLEDLKREIPVASSINALDVNGNEFATYISCDTAVYRRLMNKTAIQGYNNHKQA